MVTDQCRRSNVGVYAGENNDRFDDETTYSTGEPTRTGSAIQAGYTVDSGLPPFLNNTDVNDIMGVDQADFNGDGLLDLVSLTYHRSNVLRDGYFHDVVLNLGDGDGGFGEPIIVEQFNFTGRVPFENVSVADVNNDGSADLIWSQYQQFSSSHSFTLYTILGNGDGTFQPVITTNDGTPIGDFRVVDLDNDGHVDLVGRRQFTDDIGWLQGIGDGTFEEFVSLSPEDTFTPVRNDRTRAFQVLDLDSDGDNDIVQGRRGDKGIQVLSNDGSLNFSETAVLGAVPNGGGTYYQGIQVADFTGDGFLDLFFATYSVVQYGMFKGAADGFETTSVFVTANEPHRAPGNPAGNDRPVDIDGDGDLDLLIGHTENSVSNDNGARVLINDGTGFFSNTAHFAGVDANGQPNPDGQSSWTFTAGILSGDYNRDGVTDLVTYDSGAGQFGASDFNSVSVLLGTRPGEFAAGRSIRFGEPQPGDVEIAAADFNNDGITDILTLGGGMLSLGIGDGTFAEPFQATPGRVGDHAVLTDFNNDGNIDILMAAGGRGSGSASGFHQVILGNGDGTFEQSYLEFDVGLGFQTARVEDFNGDGYPDFISKGGFGHIEVKLNDPANPGDFTSSFLIDLEATTGYGPALDIGDFNEDGIVDFVTVERTDDLVRLQTYAGLGDGTFELVNEELDFAEGLSAVYNNFFSSPNLNLHAGDVNNDGHLDVVNFSAVGNLIHLGNGDGTFAKPTHGFVDSGATIQTTNTSLIDFDEDGNLDLVRVYPSGVASIDRGMGDGTFAKPERYNFANATGTPRIVDIDHDGHLDLIFRPGTGNANLSSQTNVLYGSRDGLVDVLAVDLNGDGNEEVLAINEDNDRLKIFVGDNLGGLTRLNDLLVGRAPRAVATADLDGDGTLELITANRAGRSISVLTGDLDSGYSVADIAVDGAPVDVEVADIDGDGNDDVVVLDEANNALWVFTGNGTTTLDAAVAVALGDVPSKFVLADANGDGQVDAVVTLPETNRVMILGGTGFQPVDSPLYVNTASAPSDVAVVDLNDDGRVDLAITLPESNVLSVHYGLGGNQFARAQQITIGETPTRVTAADADEDGRIDLIVTNSGDDTASVIFNRFDPNEVYRYNADAIDPDGDDLVYSVVDGPGGLFINGSTGELLWAASPDQVGQHMVTIEANDGNGGIATQQFVIDVQPSSENSVPLIATEPIAMIGANESFAYQVNSIDDDNDSLRYRIVDGPEGATIDPITGWLQWDGRTDAAVQLALGTSGRIDILADPSLQPETITVEGWYNFHQLTASNGRMILMKQVGGVVTEGIFNGANETTYSLHINGNREIVLQLDLGPEGTETFDLISPFVAEADRWYHFAFTFDDATRQATIYVDGVALASGVSASSLVYDSTSNSQVGEQDRFETYATIDNYRIWNVARSAADIQEGMTREYENTDQIVLDYRFEDSNTHSVFDHSSSENTGFLGPVGRRPTLVPGLANVGIHSFTIGVEDGRGGMATQTFEVEIVPELRGDIVGHVFDDLNGDAAQNDGSEEGVPAEPPLEDWLLYIDTNGNSFPDPSETQTLTDADGVYRFEDLLPGQHPIKVVPVAGFVTPTPLELSVVANETTTNDLAIEQLSLGHIRGQLLTDAAEPIAYWKVYADLNANGSRDDSDPMAISDRNGEYALTGLDAGTYNIRTEVPAGWTEAGNGLAVSLLAGEVSDDNDFTLSPTNTSITGGVHFLTTPPSSALARETMRYAAVATSIGNSPIRYDLSLAPDGLSIDPSTGRVAWLPMIGQVGEHLVILRAIDTSGSISLHDFTIKVEAPNTPPVLSNTPPVAAFVGLTYAYNIAAQDAESEALSYSLVSGPGAASLNEATGELRWTPSQSDIGSASFSVEVRDASGATTRETFSVSVSADQPSNTPFTVQSPRTEVGIGQRYFAQVAGVDALGRPLTWSLVDGPAGFVVDSDGQFDWNPGNTSLGSQSLALLATDVDGGTETFEFDLAVRGRPVISEPVIESSPIVSTVIGAEYHYDVSVVDPNNDRLSFALLDAPVGMSIHPTLGTIRWTPASDQLGEVDVAIEVTNPDGASATQSYQLKVSRAGGPPIITSVPPTQVNVGATFLYAVVARDAEGDPLTYRLLTAPAGAMISETTGEIDWTPTADQIGQQALVIQVSDGIGGAATQAFAVLVGEGIVNLAPTITSSAPRFTAVGASYEYQVIAADPESTELNYSIGRGPEGLTIDSSGLVTWTPAENQSGQFVVTLVVTDAGGASAIESYELDVLAENRTPLINSSPPLAHFAGEPFQYDVLVSDADADPLQYTLLAAPAGATIDAFGRIRWATDNDSIGQHEFELRVTDPRGGVAIHSFSLDVVADTVAPTLLLTDLNNEAGRNILPWQGPITVFVRASDNVGIDSVTLSANGQDIPLDAAGKATFTFEDWTFQVINATATAIDVNGNVTTKTIAFDYDIPEGWDNSATGGEGVPTAIIASPTDAESVTGMVTISGTAAHEAFAIYRLSYRQIDEVSYTEFLTSDTPVENGELGIWDTSLLLNDEYVIRLEVATTDGIANVVERYIGLAGELKLGNFRLSFTDMVIPVARIPIEITRIYDTLQADRQGDFGYGWRLEYRDTDLRVGLPQSGLEDIGIYSALRPGVKVFLNVPGEGRQGFTFNPDIRVLPGFGGNNLVLARPRFTPDPGVTSSLSTGTSSYLQVNEQGELYAPGGIPYNPVSPDFGGAYVLTTAEGITYRIDGASGKLNSATDRNSNTVTFSDSSIDSQSGSVQIARDSAGRVVSITDLEGQSTKYSYNNLGELAIATDRESNETVYTYASDASHFLIEVIDPLGRVGQKAFYGSDGRLQTMFDVNGNATNISYDIANFLTEVTDPLGNPIIVESDNFGNVISTTDPLGNQTRSEYSPDGLLTRLELPDGSFVSLNYDPFGNVTQMGDADGVYFRGSYDASGNLLSASNALGNTTSFSYDSAGNLLTRTAPDGNIETFQYDSRGALIATTNANGDTTLFERNSQGLIGMEVHARDGASRWGDRVLSEGGTRGHPRLESTHR